MGSHFGPPFWNTGFFFGGTQLFEGSSFGFRFGVLLVPILYPKTRQKEGRRDKRKSRKLERRKCGLDMAGAIREALEVVWKNEKTEKN